MVNKPESTPKRRFTLKPVAVALALTALPVAGAQAASPIPLGTATSFAVLGGSTITNTGPSTITGDFGLCCTGVATPGFASITQPRGAPYLGTGTLAETAQADLDIAYGNAAGQAVTNIVDPDLSLAGTPANPLIPGVYQSTSRGALRINTGLTLDFQGNPNSVFIFQGTDVVTASGSDGSVTIVNGGASPSTCNVFWQLSDETQGVTLGTNSAFKGTTMSLGASVLRTGATVEGRILTRRSKQVTLDTNTINQTSCSTAGGSDSGGGGGGGSTTPTPSGGGSDTSGGGSNPSGTTPTPSATLISATPGGAGAPGSAVLHGPSGTVSGPFTAWVSGRGISSVTFYIDGKQRSVVRAKAGRKRFAITINPRTQSHRVHRLTARVRFTAGSRTRTRKLRMVYRRPALVARGPRFTG